MKKEIKDGFVLEINNEDEIISIALNYPPPYEEPTIKLRQSVKSNGKFLVPAGVNGKVTKIYRPYSEGWTDNVVEILFDSYGSRGSNEVVVVNMRISEFV